MKILVCGDSYAVTDPSYPGLHWSEKLIAHNSDFEVVNLACGGSSNALIAMQFSQGLRFNPDFVIFSFTSCGRYELDGDKEAVPESMSYIGIANYLKSRYTTNMYEIAQSKNKDLACYLTQVASEEFEKLKNYFYIMYCLSTATARGINFCFSLGGFSQPQDYKSFLKQNFVTNEILQYRDREISINLWEYGRKSSPFFHVDDENIQLLFASQCVEFIGNKWHG